MGICNLKTNGGSYEDNSKTATFCLDIIEKLGAWNFPKKKRWWSWSVWYALRNSVVWMW